MNGMELQKEEIKRLREHIELIEQDKVIPLSNEVAYLKEVLNFQNNKLEKLSGLITEILKNNDNNILALSLLQDNDVVHDDQQVPNNSHILDGSIHSDLQAAHVAVANVALNGVNGVNNAELGDYKPKNKRKHEETKRPKISIDFIHNPMTVKEIYDEFNKGFKGQPPLAELDERYGKAAWRGDSRSKESKRYQRRKRLCDAIKKGMLKYNKSAEEIISYIEEFRGDKSLTWVMNGNLPDDLLL